MQLLNHCDLDRLYLKTLGANHKCVAVTACNSESGVSTMAMALAQRHLLAGASVLYVELNSFAPSMTALCDIDFGDELNSKEPSLNSHQNDINLAAESLSGNMTPADQGKGNHFPKPMLLASHASDEVITGIMAPQEQNAILALRNPNTLAKQLAKLGRDFDAIVIDCAPLGSAISETHANQGVPADLIATVADATILMVQAGVTKAPHLKRGIQLLQQHGVSPTAIVLNNQYNPSLGQELIRQAKRIERILPKLSQWLQQKLHQSLLMMPL